MELPKRIQKHVTETSSYKIFANSIPDHWIIREITERDYGIDCYIELVTNKGEVTGDFISIQLKGKETIKWTKKDYYTFSGIKISTTNYWYQISIPVFICLVDIKTSETFFSPVRKVIRTNFKAFVNQKKFTYKVEKSNKFDKTNLSSFIMSYFNEKMAKFLDQNISTFISHYNQYKDFIQNNMGRDYFMGVDIHRILYLKHFYNNMNFLCKYFNIDWDLKLIREYFKISKKEFGCDYDLHEHYLDEILHNLNNLLIPVLLKLREFITVEESEYWMRIDIQLFNLMYNVHDDGNIPFDI